MSKSSTVFVGMDVHKDSIEIALADATEVRRHGLKTDRRDAVKLARLARAGELTPIYAPDERDEAMRDLVSAREDAVAVQRQARQRLPALLLPAQARVTVRVVPR